MADNVKQNIEIKPRKKKRRFLYYSVLFLISFLLFLTLLVTATQTAFFKSWLKDYLTDIINEDFAKKESILKIGSIEGNFFSEIIINDANLTVQKDEMIKFDRIKVHFDIFKFYDKQIFLHEVVLQNPTANFVRIKTPQGDSLLNIVYLFTEEHSDTVRNVFEWKITVERLRIDNLNFTMLGGKLQDLPVSHLRIDNVNSFDTDKLKITNFNLETSAYYDRNSAQLQISHLGFNSNFGFDLRGLSGGFFISKQRAEVTKLNIETSNSWVQMDYVFIDNVDLMNIEGIESFKGKDMKVHMIAKKFNFDDLKSFLPAVNFLDGEVYTELKADGKFNDFKIEKCYLKTANSEMNFKGKFVNLIEPEHLYLDVEADNIVLDARDTKVYTPGLEVPDYTHIGKVTGSMSYKGEPLNFQTKFDIHTGLGDAKGFFDMNLTTPNINYRTSVETKNFNIGKIIKDDKLETNLTSRIEAEGSGFTLANINTKVTYELTDSKVAGYQIDKSSGTLNLRNYNIDLTDIKYVSGNSRMEVSGTANIRDFNNPAYSLKGNVENLDISQFTKNKDDKSNLTFTFDVKGSGYSPDNINGDFNINLANSYYSTINFPATPLDLKVYNQNGINYVTLNSNLFDFKAEGKFKLTDAGGVIAANYSNVMNEIAQKFNVDSNDNIIFSGFDKNDMDMKYTFMTKDTNAIAKMFMIDGLEFAMNMKGRMRNSANGFNLENNLYIKHFTLFDTAIIVRDFASTIVFSNDYTMYKESEQGFLQPINSSINVTSRYFKYNAQTFDSVKVNVKSENGLNTFSVSGKQDSVLYAYSKGTIDLSKDKIELAMNSLGGSYGEFDVQNSNEVLVNYYPEEAEQKIHFDKFDIKSNILKVKITGFYAVKGSSDLKIEANDISIPGLISYLSNPKRAKLTELSDLSDTLNQANTLVNGKIRRLEVSFKGTQENPEFGLEMNTGVIRYENIRIGRVDAFMDFKNNRLSPDILVSNSLGKGNLRLTGGVPLQNPFTEPDSASYIAQLTSPFNLNLNAKDFQINFFSKLIPNFADVRGFLNADLSYAGVINNASLNGQATIDKGRFLLTLNDMYYRFNTKLVAQGTDLVLDNFTLKNIEENGKALNVNGKISFEGLGIKYLDLTARGEIVALERSARNNTLGFYGDVVAGIGEPPITLTGPPSDMLVKGKLLVKDANLVFPTIQGFSYNIYEDDFTYRLLKDTIGDSYIKDTITVTSQEEFDQIDPFLEYRYVLSKKPSSILDNITFDIDAVTEKNVIVNVNFNDLTREELYGELKGTIHIDNKTDKKYQFFGIVDIVGDSYYRYYKNFKVNNSYMRFEGNPVNPVININAVYQNVRTVQGPSGSYTEKKDIILTITGTKEKPTLTLKISDPDGTVETGNDAQANAISYLIFGQPLSGINGNTAGIISQTANNAGSNILSSLIQSAARDIAPFILNVELMYNEGSLAQGTDLRITSAVGDAIVKFGGRIFSSIDNTEISIEYPLNKIINVGVSNNLILELGRSIEYNVSGTDSRSVKTGVKLTYKIQY